MENTKRKRGWDRPIFNKLSFRKVVYLPRYTSSSLSKGPHRYTHPNASKLYQTETVKRYNKNEATYWCADKFNYCDLSLKSGLLECRLFFFISLITAKFWCRFGCFNVFTKMDWHWRKFSEIWFWHFGLNFHTFSLCPNFFKHWLTDLTEPTHLSSQMSLSLIFLTKRFSLFRFIVLIEVLVFLQESLLLWVKSFQKLIVVDVEDAFSSQNLPPKIVWNNFCTS